MEVVRLEVVFLRFGAVQAQGGKTFVQLSFVILKILEDALNFAVLICLW